MALGLGTYWQSTTASGTTGGWWDDSTSTATTQPSFEGFDSTVVYVWQNTTDYHAGDVPDEEEPADEPDRPEWEAPRGPQPYSRLKPPDDPAPVRVNEHTPYQPRPPPALIPLFP